MYLSQIYHKKNMQIKTTTCARKKSVAYVNRTPVHPLALSISYAAMQQAHVALAHRQPITAFHGNYIFAILVINHRIIITELTLILY